MSLIIAVYIGGSISPGISRFLSALSNVIPDWAMMVLVGDELAVGPFEEYDYYDVERPPSKRGEDSMRLAFRDLSVYLNDDDAVDPDIIWQVKAPEIHGVPVMAAGRRHGLLTVTRITNQNFSEWRKETGVRQTVRTFVLNNLCLRLFRFADHVVALSENNRRNLVARGIPTEKVTLLKPLLDTEQFAPVTAERKADLRRELGFDDSATCPLYVGRLVDLKGMDTLVEATKRHPELEFHVAGAGPHEDALKACENVVYHGYIQASEIHKYYKAADILVHPSHTEEEGISWSMLEAAATGLPVVTRDIENASDISSFVFDEDEELFDYLSRPEEWDPATYPTEWAIDTLRSAYREFFERLR